MEKESTGHITLDDMEALPELVSTEQAALILSTPQRTLSKLAAEGAVPAVKVGRRWKFPRRKLMALAGLTDGR